MNEQEIEMLNESYYIGTDTKNNFFTLRHTYERPTYSVDTNGDSFRNGFNRYDYHVADLSHDKEIAIRQAKSMLGGRDVSA